MVQPARPATCGLWGAWGLGGLRVLAQGSPGQRVRVGGERGRRPFEDDLSAAMPAFRPHVDDPVGVADDIEVVFDDD